MESLLEKLEQYNINYVPIQNSDSSDKIQNLFCHGVLFVPQNAIECLYVGLYYKTVGKNYAKAKHYYLIAVNHGDSNAMNNLGIYYGGIESKYKKAINYFLMAVQRGNLNAMHNLAIYYETNMNYAEAKRYYLMAVDNGRKESILYLVDIYTKIKKYKKAEKYIKMAIDNNCEDAFNKSFRFYENVLKDKVKLLKFCTKYHKQIAREKIIDMIKFYWDSMSNPELAEYIVKLLLIFEFLASDNIPLSLRIFSKKLHYKIKIIRLHFEFAINSQGYIIAKEDFNKINKL